MRSQDLKAFSTDELERLGYPALLSHILIGKEYRPLLMSSNLEMHREEWRKLLRKLIVNPPQDRSISERFHTQWHVSHHFIRELVDDDKLLTDVLWVWLPRYEGPGMTLYRGENIDRLDRGKIGSAWSDAEETASMFARGLNAVGEGGVILETVAPADAIIAGPSAHSANWLREREFTVDCRRLGEVKRTRRFPPIE